MGKKSKGSKKKGSAPVPKKLHPRGNDVKARLPVKLIAIIAEHLIGDHAFGTTASLNLVSRAVRTETLPILFETLLLEPDGVEQYHSCSPADLPVGFQHTKFLFTGYETPSEQAFWKRLPNIVLIISNGPKQSGRDMYRLEEYHMHVVKPVSMSTAITILGTPVRHRPQEHAYCGAPWYVLGSIPQMLGHLREMGAPDLGKPCTEKQPDSRTRPIDSIGKVALHEGAYLHPKTSVHLQRVTTCLTLRNTQLEGVQQQGSSVDVKLVVTVHSFMRLASMQSSPQRLADGERDLLNESRNVAAGKTECRYKSGYADWHLRVPMNFATATCFVNKLKEEAKRAPEMLQYRYALMITGLVDFNGLLAMLDTFIAIYATHVKEASQILPARDDCPQIIRCEALTKIEFGDQLSTVGGPSDMKVRVAASVAVVLEKGKVTFKKVVAFKDLPEGVRKGMEDVPVWKPNE